MNGGVVNHWHNLQGYPNEFLPGCQVFGSLGERDSKYGWQDQMDLVRVDWEGNILWQCHPMDLGNKPPFHADHFYSCFISSAQHLPNGNTFITEGSDGRLFEVTADHEIVWEYISPYGAHLCRSIWSIVHVVTYMTMFLRW